MAARTGKYEVRFEGRIDNRVEMWSRRTNILDDAEGFDTFKGYQALRIEIRLNGVVLDTYVRERR